MKPVKVSGRGRMTIPKPVREALDIRAGTQLNVELSPGFGFHVTVATANHSAQVRQLAGSLAYYAKRMTPKQEKAELLKAVLADDERTKSPERRRR